MAVQDTINDLSEVGSIIQAALAGSTSVKAQAVSSLIPAAVSAGTAIAQHPDPLSLILSLVMLFKGYQQLTAVAVVAPATHE